MKAFVSVRGKALPLMQPNLDTDVIIRVERLASLPKDQLGPWALEALRYLPDGTPDPRSPLNDPRYAGASVLLAGENFGCGSSREMAVWALMGMGIACVIAPSFGDIFHSNCFQNGLLPVRVPPETAAALALEAREGRNEVFVDLQKQRLAWGERHEQPFDVEPLRRRMLLEGLDEIELTLRSAAAIDAFQQRDRALRPWVHAGVSAGRPNPDEP